MTYMLNKFGVARTKLYVKNLLSAEIFYWRQCCVFTLLDYVRNKDIRQKMAVNYTIIDTIYGKQLKWYNPLRMANEDRILKGSESR